MKQAALMVLGVFVMLAIMVGIVWMLDVAGTKTTDNFPQTPPLSVYATNTWVAERRAETMTATYSVDVR